MAVNRRTLSDYVHGMENKFRHVQVIVKSRSGRMSNAYVALPPLLFQLTRPLHNVYN